MSAINNYSTELAQTSPGNPQLYAPLKPNQQGGRVRIATFTRVYGTEAAGDNTALCKLPKGARIITGIAQVSATTGTATLAFGLMGTDASGYISADNTTTADNTAALKAAAAITTTAQVALAATVALYSNVETEKELYVTVTTAAAAMASQTLSGYILYAVD